MPACYYRCFSCREYLRLVCVVATNQSERGGVENSLVAIAEGTQLVGGLRCFDWSDDGIINPVFAFLTRVAVMIMQALGLQVVMPELQPDAFPFWDSCMMVLSIVAMILMTRKYVENWLLWVIINVISVVIFALQGVYAMSLEYIILTFIALNGSRMWINSARERGSRALSH
ncbi:nicotinamide mononucleotide transport protein [Escherichia coli]|uniref:Nicotinamide riboside transporter PnuC n=1 Tax=Escherichia coli TaxID=562 RepID=A0A377AW69_ECOLX|nr:nicotinamide mononucleotide transport protein [Escherichia coli]